MCRLYIFSGPAPRPEAEQLLLFSSRALSLIEKVERKKTNNQIKSEKSTTPCTNKQEPSKEGKNKSATSHFSLLSRSFHPPPCSRSPAAPPFEVVLTAETAYNTHLHKPERESLLCSAFLSYVLFSSPCSFVMAGILHWAACLEPTPSDISMLERTHYTLMRVRAHTHVRAVERRVKRNALRSAVCLGQLVHL